MRYVVTWTADVEADTPRDAAKKALATQRDPATATPVYEVCPFSTAHAPFLIDLRAGPGDDLPPAGVVEMRTVSVILANSVVEGVCFGTPEAAQAICDRLKAHDDEARGRAWGDSRSAPPQVQWRVVKAPVVERT
jgi:mRNA-degrading endonuclease toxin of MazEF toxin-antitoxin module